ncbi:hypothetical protein WICPIJ_007620 [Wickerhamomyces pijperi]|uniref:Uncharacterized protein n=1 Tax=Wickerhamomyces pijperi TaxID=599730 RepID=A0A9P8Q259_WICPI|nr:hypothetical protein WICPIJ_007620 [Wickerhamomyces pijperi]
MRLLPPNCLEVILLTTSLFLFLLQPTNAEILKPRGKNWLSSKTCQHLTKNFTIEAIPEKYHNSVTGDAVFYKVSDMFPKEDTSHFFYFGNQDASMKCNNTHCEPTLGLKKTLESVDIVRDRRLGKMSFRDLKRGKDFDYTVRSSGFWCVETHWTVTRSSGLKLTDIKGFEPVVQFNTEDFYRDYLFYAHFNYYALIPFAVPLIWSIVLYFFVTKRTITRGLPAMIGFFITMCAVRASHPLINVHAASHTSYHNASLNIALATLTVVVETLFDFMVCWYVFRPLVESKVCQMLTVARMFSTACFSTVYVVIRCTGNYPYILPYSTNNTEILIGIPLVQFFVNAASFLIVFSSYLSIKDKSDPNQEDTPATKTSDTIPMILSCWAVFYLVGGCLGLALTGQNVKLLDNYLTSKLLMSYYALYYVSWFVLFSLLCVSYSMKPATEGPNIPENSRTNRVRSNMVPNDSCEYINLTDLNKSQSEPGIEHEVVFEDTAKTPDVSPFNKSIFLNGLETARRRSTDSLHPSQFVHFQREAGEDV